MVRPLVVMVVWLAVLLGRTVVIHGGFVPLEEDPPTPGMPEPPLQQEQVDQPTTVSSPPMAQSAWTEHDRLDRDLSLHSPTNDTTTTTMTNAARTASQTLWMGSSMTHRLEALFQKTTSDTCRALIVRHLGYFVSALGREEALPFAGNGGFRLETTCPEPAYEDWTNLPPGMHLGHLQNRSYQPPPTQATYVQHANDLKLLYLILAHDDAPAVIRLVQALQDNDNDSTPHPHNNNSTHLKNASFSSQSPTSNKSTPTSWFVIHVDAKESSEATYQRLHDYALEHANVHVVAHPYRVRVTWGGFSMVNATLQMLQFATGHLPGQAALDFDKAIHLSATTYPLASTTEIRHELAKYPVDANFMNVIMKPQ